MTLTPTAAVKEFLENSRTHIQAPSETQGLAERSIDGFINRFLLEPAEYQALWDFGQGRKKEETGFCPERGELGQDAYDRPHRRDRKDNFHFHDYLLKNLSERGVDYSRYQDWLADCSHLLRICRELAQNFAQEFDQAFPAFNLTKSLCLEATVNNSILRLLAYREARADQSNVINDAHWDIAIATIAIRESGPGLVGGINTPDDQLQPISSLPNQPLLFAGRGTEQMTGGKIPALRHRVVHPGGRLNERTIRTAVVAFINKAGLKLTLPTH